MYDIRIILLAVAIFGCFGNVITRATRNGEYNLYYLYTRDNPREPIQILPTASGLPATNTFKSQTAIIVHGHLGSASNSLNPVVKDAFISSSDIINVIVVDWSIYASYSNAEQAVPSVGKALADFIEILVRNNRVSLDRLHLVGFDLGAHVVGFAGRTLTGRIARITGLDPPASVHSLQASDARYVEVIHTDGDGDEDGSGDGDGDGMRSNGIDTPMGHVDFYADGGHLAWELFASSLTHNQLIGNLCSTNEQLSSNMCRGYTLAMGNNDYVKYGSGIFRVNTKTTYPY